MAQQLTGESGPSTTVLTFLIADVRGYTRFTRERGNAAAAILAKRFADLARDAVEARGGRVIELRGDEALAMFESPAQAVRAAVEFQATCAEESEADPAFRLPVGIGIDSGQAVPVEDGYRGVALNMAARLCSNAAAGQVLVTRAVVDSVSPIIGEIRFLERGPASFKGFEQAVDVIEAVAAEPSPEPVEYHPVGRERDGGIPPELDPLTPLVNRGHEMRWLRGTWRQARRGRGRVLFVSGPAQIGKTRLAGEIAAHVDADGGVIRYAGLGGAATAIALSAIRATRATSTPTLLVLDDLDVAGPEVAQELMASFGEVSRHRVLVLALLRDRASAADLAPVIERGDERGDGHLVLAPLDLEGVRGIVRLYIGENEAEAPVESMARASQGVPGRVHEVASDWARSEASRRLAASAEFLAAGRDRHASDLEFANNVIGLKLGRLYSVEGRDVLPMETCPYKGLAAFEEDDSAYFFGRERLVGELAARTVQAGLLGVVGASGSGKSSVIAAGLLPSLRAGLLPGSDRWRHASMRPGDHPMIELRRALSNGAEDPLAATVPNVPIGERLVLVIDQFEETFTTCAEDEERAVFIDALTGAAQRWPDRVAVILAIRGDYYAHSAPYAELADSLAANHVLVAPLSREELRRAVELPARRGGLRVESQLTDALVADVADEPGGLPLLSTALVELWQAREAGWIRMEAYERTGGVRGAVARLAESSFGQLSDAEQEATRRVFHRLVAVGEGEALTRRRVSLEEFDLARDAAAAGVIARLTQDRLLTMGEDTVEVAHEALLREWPRLQGWLEEDAQGRKLRQHLTQASRQWESGGEEPSELYRGARLSAALDWSAEHASELNELEREYLGASRQASEREAERQRRMNRRLRGLLGGVALFLIVALIAGGLAVVQRGRARNSAATAGQAAIAEEAQRLGAQSLVEKTPALSVLLARQAVALDDSAQTRSTLLAALLRWQGALRVIRPNGNRLLRVAVSPTGNWVAFSDNDTSIFIYDVRTFRLMREINEFAFDMIASRDGRMLFVASGDGPKAVVEAFDVSTGAIDWHVTAGNAGEFGFSMSRDGRLLILDAPLESVPDPPAPYTGPTTLVVLHSADGTAARAPIPIGPSQGPLTVLGSQRVVVANGNRIEIFAIQTGRLVRTLRVGGVSGDLEGAVPCDTCLLISLAGSPDGSTLAVGESTGDVQLIDPSSGTKRTLNAPTTFATGPLSFSPDGRTVAEGGASGVVVTWDVATGAARSFHGQTSNVTGLAFTADSRTLFTDGLDSTAVEWDLAGDRGLERSFDVPSNGIPYFAFTPGGGALAVNDHAVHRIGFFDARTFAPTGALPEASFECCVPPSFDANGDRMATVDSTGVDLWDVATKTLIRRVYQSTVKEPSPGGPVGAVGLSPDGRTIAANDRGTILLLDADTGRVERRLDMGVSDIGRDSNGTVLISPRGDLVAASDGGGLVIVWDARTGRRLWRANDAGGWFPSFSADDRLYAIGTGGGLIHVYKARSGRPVGRPFVGDQCPVTSVSFNPVTEVLATTGCDGVTTLTDPITDRQIGATLPGLQSWSTVAWDPTGARLAVIRADGTGSMWDMTLSAWAAQACQTAGRILTRDEWKQFLPDRPYGPACA